MRLALHAGAWHASSDYNTLIADVSVAGDPAGIDAAVGSLHDIAHVVVAGCFGLYVTTGFVEASDDIADRYEPASFCFYQRRKTAFVRTVNLVFRHSLAEEL